MLSPREKERLLVAQSLLAHEEAPPVLIVARITEAAHLEVVEACAERRVEKELI